MPKHASYSRPCRRRFLPATAVLALAVTLGAGQNGIAQTQDQSSNAQATRSDYRLGPFDQIRVKIVAWRPSQAQVFQWEAVNGEYTLDAAGKISLPLIGEVQAADATTGDLAHLISQRLQDRLNIAQRPDTSVEIVKFRPFYIVGDVATSGEYSYRPGMTVIQAMAIAGGLPRSHAIDVHQIEREIVGWTGELNELVGERTALLAKQARLEAELTGQHEIQFPPSMKKDGGKLALAAMAQEKLSFQTRKETLQVSAQSLQELKNYLGGEVSSIKAQIEQQDKLLTLAQQDKQEVDRKQKSGLVTEQRYLAAQREAATAEGEALRLKGRLKATIEELGKADTSLLEVRSKFKEGVVSDLSATRARLQQINLKMATDRSLVSESDKIAPIWVGSRLSFSIIRRRGSSFVEFPATETTQVAPGDTIKVKCCGSEETPEASDASVQARSSQPEQAPTK